MRRLVRLFAPLACSPGRGMRRRRRWRWRWGWRRVWRPDAPDLSGRSWRWAIWTDVEQERFQAVLQAFEDDTGATITYTPAGDNMDVFLEGRLARGGEPDVAIVAQPALLRQPRRAGTSLR